MTKAMKVILQALSYGGVEVEAARRLADLKKLDPMRIFVKKLDMQIYNETYKIPVRLYFPDEEQMRAFPRREPAGKTGNGSWEGRKAILFFHGGGWTTESVETYDRVCSRMAQSIGRHVVSVEYRLAPEHRFPTGFEDCYEAAKAMFSGRILSGIRQEDIAVMGDSAGGNLAAAVCLRARDTKDFVPGCQILIYPAVNNCYTAESPYPSVQENGTGYLLTSAKMEEYLSLYERTEMDRQNPYFAPVLAKDFSGLPDTLILTAELDPLRDEGEAYGKKLEKAGGYVQIRRIPEAFHGYFALGIQHLHVQESFQHINAFLKEEEKRKRIRSGKEDTHEEEEGTALEKTGQCSPGISGSYREKGHKSVPVLLSP